MTDSMNLMSMYYQNRQISLPDVGGRVKNILSLLLSDLNNCQSNHFTSNHPRGFNRQSIHRIIEYSRQRVKERPAPQDLAKEVFLSGDYFSRVFKRTFGISAQQWLVRQRIMAIAEDLQSSEKSISEIADEYGYPDIFFFSRQFKQLMGESPRHWIQRQ